MTHFKQNRNICQATNYLQLTKCISQWPTLQVRRRKWKQPRKFCY